MRTVYIMPLLLYSDRQDFQAFLATTRNTYHNTRDVSAVFYLQGKKDILVYLLRYILNEL